MLVKTIYTASSVRPASTGRTLVFAPGSLANGPMVDSTTYHNFTTRPITVVSRNGFRQTIHPVAPDNPTQDGFIIRYERRLNYTALEEFRLFLNNVDIGGNDEIQIARDAFDLESSRSFEGKTFVHETKYTLEDFAKINTCLYCTKRDVVVSTKSLYEASPHPFDPNNKDKAAVTFMNERDLLEYFYHFEIIDNDRNIGIRYHSVCGSIKEIRPEIDYEKKSGVYHCRAVKDLLCKEGYRLQRDFYTAQEADKKFNLYRTHAEALSSTDKAAHEAAMANLKRQMEAEKREHEKELFEHEKEKILLQEQIERSKYSRDERIEELKHKTKILDDEVHVRKTVREENAHKSKIWSEVMKKLPETIIAICSIIVLLHKAKSN